MKHWIIKLSVITFVVTLGGLGGWVGSKIQGKRYPLSVIERLNLTPVVRPGDQILLAQHVDRADQCDVVIKRVIKTATGQRYYIKQEFEEGFGPMGGDKYILPVSTEPSANLGDAKMYSKAYSYCSWLDYIIPSEAEPWELYFRFGENTIQKAAPHSFDSIGVKHPSYN